MGGGKANHFIERRRGWISARPAVQSGPWTLSATMNLGDSVSASVGENAKASDGLK